MSVLFANSGNSSLASIDFVRDELRIRFGNHLSSASEMVLLNAIGLSDGEAFAAIVNANLDKKKSIRTRNQEAFALMRSRAYARVASRCELLSANEVCEILGISKQALSKKSKSGKILAYTNIRRKYYPGFQFSQNSVKPVVESLIKNLNIDAMDSNSVNLLIQHLVGKMDFSNPGEPSNVVARFNLLDDVAAIRIITRDYLNYCEMGG